MNELNGEATAKVSIIGPVAKPAPRTKREKLIATSAFNSGYRSRDSEVNRLKYMLHTEIENGKINLSKERQEAFIKVVDSIGQLTNAAASMLDNARSG